MNLNRQPWPALLLALLTTTASTAEAQEPSKPAPAPAAKADTPPPKDTKKPDTKTETIEVQGNQEYDTRRDDTATKIVVNSAEIMKFGDTQLADVLKRLPGITVQGSSIRMRGLGSGFTQILIDGERAPPGFTIDQLSPSAIERIEIVRAATAEFSTQSIAGTINIVLKRRVSLAQREVRASYAQGSFFKSFNPSFLVSDRSGNLAYTVNGYLYDNRNDFPSSSTEIGQDAQGTVILRRRTENTSDGKGWGGGIGPRLVWTLGGGDSLTWGTFVNVNRGDGVFTNRYVEAIGRPLILTSSRGGYDYLNDFFRTDLNWVAKLDGGAKLDTRVSANVNKSENGNVLTGFNAAGVKNLDRTSRTESSDTGFTFSGKYSTLVVEGHSLVGGWELGHNKRDQKSLQRDIPVPGVLPAPAAVNLAEDSNAKVVKLAAFAQDEWNVTKDWSVYLGLRWEALNTTSEGNTYSPVKNRSSVWSPLAQTLYKIPGRKGEQVRLALTRTYRAPNTANLIPRRFTAIENTPTTPDAEGNPDLKPELATGVDIAYEKFWGQGASVSLSASMRHITDYNRRGLLFINNRWVSKPINDGTADTRSIEFDAKFPVQSIWKEAPPIDFRFNANRNWSKVESVPGPNNRLDQQTPFSATLGLDYRMKSGEWVAGTSYSYRAGGDVRISSTQTAFLTAKRDLDAYVLWKMTPKVQWRLTMSNILKPKSINENGYIDQFGSSRTSTETPSKMNLRAGVEYKF